MRYFSGTKVESVSHAVENCNCANKVLRGSGICMQKIGMFNMPGAFCWSLHYNMTIFG